MKMFSLQLAITIPIMEYMHLVNNQEIFLCYFLFLHNNQMLYLFACQKIFFCLQQCHVEKKCQEICYCLSRQPHEYPQAIPQFPLVPNQYQAALIITPLIC